MSSLEKHIEMMRSDELFEGTDFKLASCDGPSNERIARECGFTDLSVRVVKVKFLDQFVQYFLHLMIMVAFARSYISLA